MGTHVPEIFMYVLGFWGIESMWSGSLANLSLNKYSASDGQSSFLLKLRARSQLYYICHVHSCTTYKKKSESKKEKVLLLSLLLFRQPDVFNT